jgi:cobalt-zinc-cadmium efflux system protein
MIVFAIVGAAVNLIAAFVTKDGDSLNQRAVNLHMLEDVLGWLVVLIGAIIMRFSNITVLDPIMSIGVAIFIIINALHNLKDSLNLFLEKAPDEINVSEIKEHLEKIDGIIDIHHVHLWSLDGQLHYATLHAVTSKDAHVIKHKIREELKEHGINHVTIELEFEGEHCHESDCRIEHGSSSGHHHHHHHHHKHH